MWYKIPRQEQCRCALNHQAARHQPNTLWMETRAYFSQAGAALQCGDKLGAGGSPNTCTRHPKPTLPGSERSRQSMGLVTEPHESLCKVEESASFSEVSTDLSIPLGIVNGKRTNQLKQQQIFGSLVLSPGMAYHQYWQ
ncbi:hypothetical protein Anapl_17795 [Anas platyrhynchos]|uniref:Uncharacterized protein n=1 Tax=Anas platyrhynchos TaxID=8839 RepID=R0L4J8_ANAPL|nr:hypothetical protein Anapl_17795 [Anas platyrhynchos]